VAAHEIFRIHVASRLAPMRPGKLNQVFCGSESTSASGRELSHSTPVGTVRRMSQWTVLQRVIEFLVQCAAMVSVEVVDARVG
jgi:hypothetical protein